MRRPTTKSRQSSYKTTLCDCDHRVNFAAVVGAVAVAVVAAARSLCNLFLMLARTRTAFGSLTKLAFVCNFWALELAAERVCEYESVCTYEIRILYTRTFYIHIFINMGGGGA